jgi:adenylosuccinate lyase
MKTVDLIPKQQDSVITQVRCIKQKRAEKFGYDVVAMAKDLQAQEKDDPRFVHLGPASEATRPDH